MDVSEIWDWMERGYRLVRDIISLHPAMDAANNQRLARVTYEYELWRQEFKQLPKLSLLIHYFYTLDSWDLRMDVFEILAIGFEMDHIKREGMVLVIYSQAFAEAASR